MDFVAQLLMKNVKMKINPFLVLGLLLIGAITTSCRKCNQCSFNSQNQTYLSERECGSKEDRKALEDTWSQRAQDSLTNATCTEKNN